MVDVVNVGRYRDASEQGTCPYIGCLSPWRADVLDVFDRLAPGVNTKGGSVNTKGFALCFLVLSAPMSRF